MTPALTAYTAGQMFYFVAGGANTGAVTLNIDGLGSRNMTRHGSVALVAGDILSGEVCVVVYDGTRFQLLNPASYTNLNVTGVLSLAAGTALLPSLAFTGDPNTGMWSPAADTIAFSEGGVEAMRLDSSGNLGIGTNTPGAMLDVAGNAEFGSANQVRLGSGVFAASLASISPSTGRLDIGTTTAADVSVFANNTERFRVESSGSIRAGAASALATTATDGFLYVPTCAGTPTGTPTAITGMAPIVVNTTNNKLYFYSTGVWRDAGP
jgi:hypothetical protein